VNVTDGPGMVVMLGLRRYPRPPVAVTHPPMRSRWRAQWLAHRCMFSLKPGRSAGL